MSETTTGINRDELDNFTHTIGLPKPTPPKSHNELLSRWEGLKNMLEKENEMDFKMDAWAMAIDSAGRSFPPRDLEHHPCRTAGCIAGLAAMTWFKEEAQSQPHVPIKDFGDQDEKFLRASLMHAPVLAEIYLHLSADAADCLFAEDIRTMSHKAIALDVIKEIASEVGDAGKPEEIMDKGISLRTVLEAKACVFGGYARAPLAKMGAADAGQEAHRQILPNRCLGYPPPSPPPRAGNKKESPTTLIAKTQAAGNAAIITAALKKNPEALKNTRFGRFVHESLGLPASQKPEDLKACIKLLQEQLRMSEDAAEALDHIAWNLGTRFRFNRNAWRVKNTLETLQQIQNEHLIHRNEEGLIEVRYHF